MKNILITGGAGFIGSHLVKFFVENYPKYNIINLDSLTYAGNLDNLKEIEHKSNYKFIQEDICNHIKIKETRSFIITKEDKNSLSGFLEKLNLTTPHKLKAPSMKHQYDGAMFTTIEIVWDDKKYKSAGFDDDNPPKELIPFFHY